MAVLGTISASLATIDLKAPVADAQQAKAVGGTRTIYKDIYLTGQCQVLRFSGLISLEPQVG
jgi:hypothetical protein